MVIFKVSKVLFMFFIFLSASISIANVNSVEFRFSLLSALSKNSEAIEFYEENNFKPIWVGRDRSSRDRSSYFFKELKNTSKHALPTLRYDAIYLNNQFRKARTATELGLVEALLTSKFLEYSSNIQTGILKPASVDKEIVRKIPYRSVGDYLKTFLSVTPREFFKGLHPQSKQYSTLLTEKNRLEKIISQGGWSGELPLELLRPGDIGDDVVLLRNALIKRGYLKSNLSKNYYGNLRRAVQLFQLRHGLAPDGIAGPATFSEIERTAEERLASVIVALERERWTNFDLGSRHVLVNLPDFSTKLFEDGALIFETRNVIGTPVDEQRTPEFSDTIEHIITNPTWNVPKSITLKEYLPEMQEDPLAHDYLELVDLDREIVPRSFVDFNEYDEETFPYDLKQMPSITNALGLVKFMFPNQYSIYLHDTPSKPLFDLEVRAFSHGCIRLQKPFEFAYELLKPQTSDPKAQFQEAIGTGEETVVYLRKPVQVHLIYRTAFVDELGVINYRRDIYGRDAAIYEALIKAGIQAKSLYGQKLKKTG
ncbi:MAG: L,D-transpeptidase family protein [Paracoccaceae bacterium]|nr:L,D-transpeptidase family protein [Paracoccaceae bacterium]